MYIRQLRNKINRLVRQTDLSSTIERNCLEFYLSCDFYIIQNVMTNLKSVTEFDRFKEISINALQLQRTIRSSQVPFSTV